MERILFESKEVDFEILENHKLTFTKNHSSLIDEGCTYSQNDE